MAVMIEIPRKVFMDEYEKIEIEQIYDGIKSIENLSVQIYSFFGTANVTILGVALSLQVSGLILVAALMIGLLGLIHRQTKNHAKVYYLRGTQLENKYAKEPDGALLHLYINKVNYFGQSRVRQYWIPLTIFAVEVLMAFIAAYILKWPWF